MRAVILAGGLGSRLKPFTVVIPKPLVPVGDRPIIDILIRQLQAQGFRRITISVGYLAALIRAYCGDGERWGVRIDYVEEEEPLGTAGFLALIDDLAEDRLLVVNGDSLTDLDMGEVYRLHNPSSGATICTSRRTVNIEFGVVESDADRRLSEYIEKPQLDYEVSMGINVLSTWTIKRFVPLPRRMDMPDLMRAIVEAGERVDVRRSDAYWLDMGRLSDLERAVTAFTEHPERFLP
jgi:NDP-mannose synthase